MKCFILKTYEKLYHNNILKWHSKNIKNACSCDILSNFKNTRLDFVNFLTRYNVIPKIHVPRQKPACKLNCRGPNDSVWDLLA